MEKSILGLAYPLANFYQANDELLILSGALTLKLEKRSQIIAFCIHLDL